MKGHTIITHWQSTPQLWMATFENYDGAPDSKHPQGFGKTKAEAVADLIEMADESSGDPQRSV
jgi:hypothetical protein